MEFKLPYYVRDLGDGSVKVEFCPTVSMAKILEDTDSQPFAEGSVNIIKLKVEDNQLFFRQLCRGEDGYEWVWTKVLEGR